MVRPVATISLGGHAALEQGLDDEAAEVAGGSGDDDGHGWFLSGFDGWSARANRRHSARYFPKESTHFEVRY